MLHVQVISSERRLTLTREESSLFSQRRAPKRAASKHRQPNVKWNRQCTQRPSGWRLFRMAVRSKLLPQWLAHTRAQREAKAYAATKTPEGVKTHVASLGQLRELEWWQQGDMEMYSLDNTLARFELRQHPLVLEALHSWWICVLRSLRQDAPEGAECVVNRKAYVAIFHKVYRVSRTRSSWHSDLSLSAAFPPLSTAYILSVAT